MKMLCSAAMRLTASIQLRSVGRLVVPGIICFFLVACSSAKPDGGAATAESAGVTRQVAELHQQCDRLRSQWKANHREIRQYASAYQQTKANRHLMAGVDSYRVNERKARAPQRRQKAVIEKVRALGAREKALTGSITHCIARDLFVRNITSSVKRYP